MENATSIVLNYFRDMVWADASVKKELITVDKLQTILDNSDYIYLIKFINRDKIMVAIRLVNEKIESDTNGIVLFDMEFKLREFVEYKEIEFLIKIKTSDYNDKKMIIPINHHKMA